MYKTSTLNLKRIVITGAPGTGKTAVINALETAGYPCFPEVIREFTQTEASQKSAQELKSNPIVFASDSLAFNNKLIAGRKNQFYNANLNVHPFNFYDRGLPDVLAYMDFFGQAYPSSYMEICKNHKYDQVFIMPPWEDIFHADDGRFESYGEALELHQSLMSHYQYFGYRPIHVPVDSVSKRADYIIEHLQATL